MTRKKTTKEYIEECKEGGYDLPIESYVNAMTKIKHKCDKGHVYKQKPNSHLRGNGCPCCSGKVLKTNEIYIKECKDMGYDLPIEEYKGTHTPINHRCKKCGNNYRQRPHSHLQGQGCPKCATHNRKLNNKGKTGNKDSVWYFKKCKDLGYDLPIEPYVNTSTKIKHRCNNCEYVYKQTPNNHLNGHGCPNCCIGGPNKKTTKQYVKECKELGIDLPIESYIDAKTPIKHKCDKGHVYKQAPYYRLHYGDGCPVCNESHGEKFIRNYLDNNHIKYIPQKKFHDLKDKTYLSYDFYLPKQAILIEYQGIQHFEKGTGYMDRQGRLEKQQYHDKLKCEYAINNGYKLLEPTYELDTQEKINKYLDKHI